MHNLFILECYSIRGSQFLLHNVGRKSFLWSFFVRKNKNKILFSLKKSFVECWKLRKKNSKLTKSEDLDEKTGTLGYEE